MENIWTKINSEIPKYFYTIVDTYSLNLIRISDLKTAIVGEKYALLISIDRFSADVDYVMWNAEDEVVIYGCGNFFAEKYDDSDRKNLLQGDTAEKLVINNLIIMNSGLQSKWKEVLQGSTEWLINFKASKWYNEKRISQEELNIIRKYI